MTNQQNKASYNYREIESYWRHRWIEEKTFKTYSPNEIKTPTQRPKCYVLDMFPYPSGDGLHVGHPKGYIASDIYSRFKRMQGFNVLHPMGFDSFGLPAEQYALEHNIHPAESTQLCIERIRVQLQSLGLSYDWDREIATSDETFYRWTQWIFLQLYDCWFDDEIDWIDDVGRTVHGRAVPIKNLIEQFINETKYLTASDLRSLTNDFDLDCFDKSTTWAQLNEAQQSSVLNNYRLAYQKEVTVNWCPELGTVLANEEVTNEGRSERGDFPVYQRPLKQWILRITAYADRLLEDLDSSDLPDGRGGSYKLDWPEPIKLMQRNWIGRSEGAEVLFDLLPIESNKNVDNLVVFTTRPDTLFGATFMVVSPEHPIVSSDHNNYMVPPEWPKDTKSSWKLNAANPQIAIAQYVSESASKSSNARDIDSREKTGVFTGIFAKNPVSDSVIPVFAADYVSMDYGTGAIMAVPAHDDRDHEFAKLYDLEIVDVVAPPSELEVENKTCFTGEGTSINSPSTGDNEYTITGLETTAAKAKIIAHLERTSRGRFSIRYKLRDWIFSRQRYWGEPFPLATKPNGTTVSVSPPVTLPEMEDFKPATSANPNTPVSPPLGRAELSWRQTQIDCEQCERELNVMPQWAGSCWYFLRFIDPLNSESFCATEKEQHFMPVDLYIGGAEHAVLHLLYTRFWHKALFDLGCVSSPEPFKKLFNQGMITADAFTDDRGIYIDIRKVEFRNGEPFHSETGNKLKRSTGKMGKRYKNGLPPEEVGEEYGVDTLRLYEMYMGPLEQSAPWSMEGIRGMQRFLHRVWRNLVSPKRTPKILPEGADHLEVRKKLHKTISKVTTDIDGLRLNTAIAALIELNNDLVDKEGVHEEVARTMILLLSPFAPHISEELWRIWDFGDGNISVQNWPEANLNLITEDTVTIPIQVNGKVRGNIDVPVGIDESQAKELILELENLRRHVPNPEAMKRFIYVPNKIINIVT